MNNVLVIEDNETLNEVFCRTVNDLDDFKVSGSYLNAENAIANLKRDWPNLILMDIELPGINGIEATKKIKQIHPEVLIIMITVFENSKYVFDALCAGACGYLTKNATGSKIEKALKEAINGGAPMSIQIAKMVVESFRKAPTSVLTTKETEVLSLLAKGNSYKGVALKMNISPNTIKYHVKNIYDKLEVHDKESAIEEANNRRII
ncbi:DNA-binding response regulator [Winogradskyella sp. J14-2]|jgi:DNA-binding NarL/FixJ family response regulator|uniref:response regulator n=1 Tax=Winogradskyella sp. J14-2 TaxID=1936080 RepID=UPI0009727D5A|nr:response regulator transcription factor [Winogradskyella sp. J14-2]APY07191.1 DNA-binding response regulator [Winogradskyella sp. J14-2]